MKLNMKTISLLSCFALLSVLGFAQHPASDVYLADLDIVEGMFEINNIENLSNRPSGYDDQPSFSPDGTNLVYSSLREGGQTDIYWYSFTFQNAHPVTRTGSRSEYSPHYMGEGEFVSVVAKEGVDQKLWKIPLTGGQAKEMLPNYTNIGYYTWLSSSKVALYLIGDNPTIEVVDVNSGAGTPIAGSQGLGRTIKNIPTTEKLSYVLKSNDNNYIVSYDPGTKEMTKIVDGLGDSEDFDWSSDGSIFMADGPRLYKYTPNIDEGWIILHDFGSMGISKITRISISPGGDKIAFTSEYGIDATQGVTGATTATTSSSNNVTLTRGLNGLEGDAFVNDIMKIKYTFEQGGSSILVSHDIGLTLKSVNTIESSDYIGNNPFTFKDGTTIPSDRFKLKSLTIGGKVLKNVECIIDGNLSQQMLIGEVALSKYARVNLSGSTLSVE